MTFPIVRYKATNITIDPSWQTLVDQKFQTLEKYIGEDSSATCDVEFEKETGDHHNTGMLHRVEANLFTHGRLYRAEASLETFEQAIDVVRAELDRELAKANEKRETLIKRGGRKIKDMLRFGRSI